MTRRPDIPADAEVIGTQSTRYEAGTQTEYGELSRLLLTAEQHEAMRRIEWTNVDPRRLPTEADIAADPEKRFGVSIPARNAVAVYAGGRWPVESTPENVCVVFDARTRLKHPKPSVPLQIRSPTGEKLTLRGVSRSCPTWPVERGDRVFIELTEARAHQISHELFDRIKAEHPEALPAIMAAHEDEACMLRCAAEVARDSDWPDLATATAAMAAHLNAPEAIAERTEHAATVPGGRAGDQPAMASSPDAGVAELLAALAAAVTASAGQRARVEQTRIAMEFMRGLLASDAGWRKLMCECATVHPSGFADCGMSGFLDPDTLEPLDPEAWLAMRFDPDRVFLDAQMLRRPGNEYDIQIKIERVGIRITPHKHPPCDVGYMMSYRFVHGLERPNAGDATSPWLMYQHWPPGAANKASAESVLKRSIARPNEIARCLMTHMIEFSDASDVISRGMDAAEARGKA